MNGSFFGGFSWYGEANGVLAWGLRGNHVFRRSDDFLAIPGSKVSPEIRRITVSGIPPLSSGKPVEDGQYPW